MSNPSLYPLRFDPIFKDKLWGGQKIHTVLGKDFRPLPNCGETWEISGVSGNISVINNGPLAGKTLTELLSEQGAAVLGKRVQQAYGNEFPLLVKFIDANDDLSVQVHPDDALAEERHGPGSKGKTEMWYIFQADPGASLIVGFQEPMNRERYQQAVEAGKLMDILNREVVEEGDVFFLPAGRVHTIGKGLLLAEIQQTSDITYRMYDFERTDADGNQRELHLEAALEAIDFQEVETYKTQYEDKANEATELVTCPFFETKRIAATKPISRDYSELDSFVILVGVGGGFRLRVPGQAESWELKMGDAYLLPACLSCIELEPMGEGIVLESWIPTM